MLMISVQAKTKPGTSFDSGLESSTLVIDEGQTDPRIPKMKREKSFRIPRSMNSALQSCLSDTESEPSPAKRPRVSDTVKPSVLTKQTEEKQAAPQAGIPE